jgi:hypothetical protein
MRLRLQCSGLRQCAVWYCHVYEWLYTGFRLVIGFFKHLRIVTTSNCIGLSLIHTLYNSLQQALSLLSLLYLHRLSPGSGFQRRSFLSYRVRTLTGRRLSHNSLNSRLVLLVTPRHGPHKNTSPSSSSIVVSRSCRADRVDNVAYQLLHWCMLRICCGHYVATAVVYRVVA